MKLRKFLSSLLCLVMPSQQLDLRAGDNDPIALPLPATLASGLYFLQVQAVGVAQNRVTKVISIQ